MQIFFSSSLLSNTQVIVLAHGPLFLSLKTQEEMCDLKQAAPFQNVIPKPFIPIRGKILSNDEDV